MYLSENSVMVQTLVMLNGGRVRVTYESNDFLELNINIFK
jgi:hypothetical protein